MHLQVALRQTFKSFSRVFSRYILVLSFSFISRREFLSCVSILSCISAMKSVLTVVHTWINVLWQIIRNENGGLFHNDFLVQEHIFASFWETAKLDMRESFMKSELFILTFLCGILFMILLVCTLFCYLLYFLNVLFWEK